MATPAVTLITNGGPYAQIANPRLRKAITVYGKLAFCNASPYNYTAAGTAMTAANIQTAITDMRNAIGALNAEQIAAARAFIWAKSATATQFAGAKITLATQSVDAAITYLASLDMATLELMDLWGEYALNVTVNGLP